MPGEDDRRRDSAGIDPDHRRREDAPRPEPAARREADGGREGWFPGGIRLTIAKREIASLRNEKTILLALAIQLFVAAFSSFLVVGLVSLYDPGAAQGFSPEFGVAGNASDEVIDVVREEGIEPRRYESGSEAVEAFRDREVAAVIWANFSADGQVQVRLIAPSETFQTTLIVVKSQDVLEGLEDTLRERYYREGRLDTSPLPVPEQVPSSPYFAFSYTVLIPLLMFLPAFISGSIAVDSVTEEVQRGTLELLRVAPVELSDIVDAKLLSTATLAPAQAALWIVLLGLNGTAVVHWAPLLAMVAGISMAIVAAGVGISLLAPDRRQAQFLYSTGVLAMATLAVLLPEHPANTIAKLAIGSATTETWLFVAGYALAGVVAYVAVRAAVGWTDPEGL